MGLLVLVRPPNQVLIIFALLPLFVAGPWRRRLEWGAAFFLASTVVSQGWKAAMELRFGDAVAGGIVTGILLLAISAASALVLQNVSDLSVIYGSITVVLVFLYSVYLYASAVLLGAEVAAAWSAPSAGPAEPIRVQVRRAVLGLFVHQEPPPQPTAPPPDQPPR